MATKKERLEESLRNIEEEIKHHEYEIRQLKAEWDLVYSNLIDERIKANYNNLSEV